VVVVNGVPTRGHACSPITFNIDANETCDCTMLDRLTHNIIDIPSSSVPGAGGRIRFSIATICGCAQYDDYDFRLVPTSPYTISDIWLSEENGLHFINVAPNTGGTREIGYCIEIKIGSVWCELLCDAITQESNCNCQDTLITPYSSYITIEWYDGDYHYNEFGYTTTCDSDYVTVSLPRNACGMMYVEITYASGAGNFYQSINKYISGSGDYDYYYLQFGINNHDGQYSNYTYKAYFVDDSGNKIFADNCYVTGTLKQHWCYQGGGCSCNDESVIINPNQQPSDHYTMGTTHQLVGTITSTITNPSCYRYAVTTAQEQIITAVTIENGNEIYASFTNDPTKFTQPNENVTVNVRVQDVNNPTFYCQGLITSIQFWVDCTSC
jgi:hypothetical protein